MRVSASFLLAALLVLLPAPASADEKISISDVVVQCAACHGVDGIAKSADVPHLAGQQDLYLFNQLKAFRSGKRPHREMRYMSRQLSDAEMIEISKLYSALPR